MAIGLHYYKIGGELAEFGEQSGQALLVRAFPCAMYGLVLCVWCQGWPAFWNHLDIIMYHILDPTLVCFCYVCFPPAFCGR